MRYGVHGSCGPGLRTRPTCSGITGSHSVCTPGEFDGSTSPTTGLCAWKLIGTPRSSPWPVESTSSARPRVNESRMRRISASTDAFFFMFARHMRSGSPVLADCARTHSSADCVPSPIGSVRSEEHTSELQSPDHLVCRLLLEKKNKNNHTCTDRARVCRYA